MRCLAKYCIFFFLIVSLHAQDTIWSSMNRDPALSKIVSEIKRFPDIQEKLSKEACAPVSCETIFAPTNEALNNTQKLPKETIEYHLFSMSSDEGRPVSPTFENIKKFALPIIDQTTDIMGSKVYVVSFEDKQRFFFEKSGIMYNGNAKVERSRNVGSSGLILYVVNRVLDPKLKFQNFRAYVGSNQNNKMREYGSRLELILGEPGFSPAPTYQIDNGKKMCAVHFVPVDSAWNKIPQELRNRLNENKTALQLVMAHHIGYKQLLFPQWASDLPAKNFTFDVGYNNFANIPAVGRAEIFQGADNIYYIRVGAVTAQILNPTPDILHQAVVYHIDAVLGFLYGTKASIAEKKAPMFYSACKNNDVCNRLLNAPGNTMILFNDVAFRYYSKNATGSAAGSFFNAVVLPRVVKVSSLTSTQVYTPINRNYFWRYRKHEQTPYFDFRGSGVGFVAHPILESDLTTSDGVVHVIGEGCCPDDNVKQFLQNFMGGAYRKLSEVWKVPDVSLEAVPGALTVFAPSNQAYMDFENDRSSSRGSLIAANSEALEKVLRRHVIMQWVLFDEYPKSRVLRFQAPTANFRDTREYLNITRLQNEEMSIILNERTVTIDGRVGGFQAKNGYVYPVNEVFYSPHDIQS